MKIHLILILFLLGITISAFAEHGTEDRATFEYNGGQDPVSRQLTTEQYRTVDRYVQVPYQHQVCHMETTYRQECRQVPHTRRVCHMETTYRQVCTTSPSRRVCENRQRCRQVNGRRVCTNERVCRTVPGRRTCRQVPHRHQVCRNETTYRRVCRQVPHQHQVCRYETRYRTERRSVSELVSRAQANTSFQFMKAPNMVVNARFDILLNGNRLSVAAENLNNQDRALFLAQVQENRNNDGLTETIDAQFNVRVLDLIKYFSPVSQKYRIRKRTMQRKLNVVIPKLHYRETLGVALKIEDHHGKVLVDRRLVQGEYSFVDHPDRLTETLMIVNVGQILGSKYEAGSRVKVRVTGNLTLEGKTILNREQLPGNNVVTEEDVMLN